MPPSAAPFALGCLFRIGGGGGGDGSTPGFAKRGEEKRNHVLPPPPPPNSSRVWFSQSSLLGRGPFPSFLLPPLCSLPFRALESICQKLGGGRRRGAGEEGGRRKGVGDDQEKEEKARVLPAGRPIICHAISLFCAPERGRKRANNRGL